MTDEDKKKKYVVLEHLQGYDKGWRFWTSNSDRDVTISHDEHGKRIVAYKPIIFTDSEEEAIRVSRGDKSDIDHFAHHIESYPVEVLEALLHNDDDNEE